MTMLAKTIVDWHALEQVVLYSLIAGLGVPAIYSFAVLGAARSMDRARERRNGAATAYGLLSIVGAAACLFAVAYGIWLMTQK